MVASQILINLDELQPCTRVKKMFIAFAKVLPRYLHQFDGNRELHFPYIEQNGEHHFCLLIASTKNKNKLIKFEHPKQNLKTNPSANLGAGNNMEHHLSLPFRVVSS
jgi:hypothetical protein